MECNSLKLDRFHLSFILYDIIFINKSRSDLKMSLAERMKLQIKKIFSEKIMMWSAFCLMAITLLASILFFVIWPDNLMHSDMAAEVLLSKLLSQEGGLISKNWFYSTEIRIVYTQLVMTPLFWFIKDFGTVKLISVVIYDVLLAVVFYFTGKEFGLKKASLFLTGALLVAPLSNEYFDMLLLGNFYTSQVICTYLMLLFIYKIYSKKAYSKWIACGLLSAASLILGLSGLRYLACLFIPAVLSILIAYGFDKREKEEETLKHYPLSEKLILTVGISFFAGIGLLINKLVLAKQYSFDQTEIMFVPISELPDRFLKSVYLMIELLGYREIHAVSGLGIVNCVKFAFFVLLIYAIIFVTKHRNEILSAKQKLLLYYFYGLLVLNWYMLVFTDVLQQYRYWLPVYIIAIIFLGIYIQNATEKTIYIKPAAVFLAVLAVVSSLYGELWQDTKYNDCEKRYGYMKYLEDHDYEFGYATFWNSVVTEYLANGEIHVGNLGGNANGSAPYEWLTPKAYYQDGYHTGKTFMLLAKTEEPALFSGDITVMTDSVKVYEDEYYVIYEGEGMYLFSDAQ